MAFRQRLLRLMEHHEQGWGDLLEAQYDEALDEDEDETEGDGHGRDEHADRNNHDDTVSESSTTKPPMPR